MKYSSFVKVGNEVFCTRFREAVTIEEILDLANENVPKKKEIDAYPNLINVYVLDSNLDSYCVGADDLQPLRHIDDLSYEELEELRGQICIGSCYISSYENTLGVKAEEVCDYSDAYCDAIGWDFSKDSAENFADFCADGCLYLDESA